MGDQESLKIKADIRLLERERDKLRDDIDRISKAKSLQLQGLESNILKQQAELDRINSLIADGTKKVRAINDSLREKAGIIEKHAESVMVESVAKANDRLKASGALSQAIVSAQEEIEKGKKDLEEKTKLIAQRTIDQDAREIGLDKRETAIKKREAESNELFIKAKKSEEIAMDHQNEADSNRRLAAKTLVDARKKAEAVTSDLDERIAEVEKAEAGKEQKIKMIEARESELARDRERLQKREVVVLDKERTLRRAFAELKKKGAKHG